MRDLQPYSFDEDPRDHLSEAADKKVFAPNSSSGFDFQPYSEYKRGLKMNTKEIDEEQGYFLTAMSPEKGEESSSSDPSSVTSRGESDSEESERYSPTSPRENLPDRFSSSPRKASPSLVRKGNSPSSPTKGVTVAYPGLY